MKSVSDILHKTPWWALLFGGLATLCALAIFVTPYHIIRYRDDGKTAAESRAIKREIDNAFAENAINLGRGVIRGMLSRTTDPTRREELEQALQGLEEARQELREAGSEVLRAKREALQSAREAARGMREAVRNAQRETERAIKGAGVDSEAAVKQIEATRKELERSLKQAEAAERAAERDMRRSEKLSGLRVGPGKGDKPANPIDIDPDVEARALPQPPLPDAKGLPPGSPPAIPAPPISPEAATKIRRDVTGDMYRIGIGAGLILILIPIFIVAVVVKFFADRSRVSQKVADDKRREAEYHRMSQQVTEAKLSALQAQVEPHFLYNTLASVQALTEVDPARASEMTGHLIQYLRNALPKMRESVSTIGQEVELARAYLNILQMRMGKRLSFEIDVPADMAEMPFPPLMLPSLVENAIKHGLEPQREGGMVRITATREGGRLRLVVADTGRGFSETPGAGVGLANIRERLAALYGESAKLTLEANEPHGVVASIDVPAEGTRAAALAGAIEPTLGPMEPIVPMAAPLAPAVKSGFWPRVWAGLVVTERIWRKALWYLYLALVMLAAAAAVAAIVAVAAGSLPVVIDETALGGPAGFLIALAGAVIGFVALAAAFALVCLILYGLGYLLFGVLIFVVIVILLSVSPILAPLILLGLAIWWWGFRKKPAPPAPPVRVEPTMAESSGS